MLDAVFMLLLVVVVGLLAWMEREQIRMFFRGGSLAPGEGTRGYYWRLARQAGLSPDDAWPYYLGAKVILALAAPLAALDYVGLVAWLLGPIGFMVPDALLASIRKQRRAAIQRSLSFFLDLMLSLLQAGLSLEEAFRRAAREGLPASHPLAAEAALVVEELDAGRERGAGFHALAERTGVESLAALANAMRIGMSRGLSIEATLKAQADLARAKRREDGMQRLDRASAEVLLPLMLCSFPLFVVLVIMPLAMQVLRSLQSLGGALR